MFIAPLSNFLLIIFLLLMGVRESSTYNFWICVVFKGLGDLCLPVERRAFYKPGAGGGFGEGTTSQRNQKEQKESTNTRGWVAWGPPDKGNVPELCMEYQTVKFLKSSVSILGQRTTSRTYQSLRRTQGGCPSTTSPCKN